MIYLLDILILKKSITLALENDTLETRRDGFHIEG